MSIVTTSFDLEINTPLEFGSISSAEGKSQGAAMTTQDMKAFGGEHEHERSSESGISPVAHDQFEAAFSMGAGCLKARDIEAVVMSGVYGDPMAQRAWSSVRKAWNRIF
jgi:hypothetical protein